MKIHLYLLTPALVELLLRAGHTQGLAGALFDSIYGAYKPEKVDKQNSLHVESELVSKIGTPTDEEAKGLREIAAELQRLRQLAAQGRDLGNVGPLILGFINQFDYRKKAIEFLEKRMLPVAAKRFRGKPVVVYPTAANLANPNVRDRFAKLLQELRDKERRATSATSNYAPMPTAPASMEEEPIYGSGPAFAQAEYEAVGDPFFVTDGDDVADPDDNNAAVASTTDWRQRNRDTDDNA